MLPDELKNVWNECNELQLAHNRLDAAMVRQALHDKIASQAKGLRNALLFDLGIALLMGLPALLLRKYWLVSQLQTLFVILFAFAVAATVALLPLKFAALRLELGGQPPISSLKAAIGRFRRLVHAHCALGLASPLLGFAIACKVYYGVFIPSPSPAYWGALFLTLAVAALWFGFALWYTDWLYGSHLRQLEDCCEQLGELPE